MPTNFCLLPIPIHVSLAWRKNPSTKIGEDAKKVYIFIFLEISIGKNTINDTHCGLKIISQKKFYANVFRIYVCHI